MRSLLGLILAAACLYAGAAPARADWNGDAKSDVLAVDSSGRLLLYRGTGAGAFVPGGGQPIGTGWGAFGALLAPGDWSGDGKPDLLARTTDGLLLLYRGNGSGGFLSGSGEQIGTGWQSFTALFTPRDWNGDGQPDLLARTSAGALLLYRGNGHGGFLQPTAQQIGASGWQAFTALLGPTDWSGDGKADLLDLDGDGKLFMYRGDGHGGFMTGRREQIGAGWQVFDALVAGGDFSGDGRPDIIARDANGLLFMYRGNGHGGFITGQRERIGSGWSSLSGLMLLWDPSPPAAPAPGPVAPPTTAIPDGSAKIRFTKGCTRPGGRLKIRMRIRRRAGRTPPRVLFVVFSVRHGAKRVDHRRPFVVRLRMNQPAGKKGRVYARVYYRRSGSRKLRHKTVSKRFKMCRLAR
ncbi:MAG: VCBS repeat-containing protein [Solirubrobacteraceae bacterium]